MTTRKVNLAASVAARLLNESKRTGDVYQTILTRYCFERFLYRLGVSNARDRFVLKGAMLLRLWADQPYRATRDLDLLRSGDDSPEAVRADLVAICETPVEPDAVTFDLSSLGLAAIRAEGEYAGTRATLTARCGSARLALQIDMGCGDSVWPAPTSCAYPTLLDLPAPAVLVYPRETVVAEKLDAIVTLGERNSRIKDHFDLHYLASRFAFDRAVLTEAVRRTFARRRTPIPTDTPIGLMSAYWDNPTRPAQVLAFTRRSGLALEGYPPHEIAHLLGTFLLPVLGDLKQSSTQQGTWVPGGPWSPDVGMSSA